MQPQATETGSRPDPIARIVAVAALVVATVVVVIVISDSIGGSSDGNGGREGRTHSKPHEKYYVVQPGDTFGGIAQDQGIPIPRLEALNPKLDTQLLPQKGCVNLVPEGCKVLASGG